MAISFSCKSCGRSYSVSESLAGKKAKCKDCGVEFRVPMPPSAAPRPPAVARPSRPVAPPVEDRFGFDELPAPRPLYEVEDEPVLPRRAPATWKPRESASRRSSDGGDSANSFCFGGFWTWVFGFVFVFATVVSMFQAKDGGSHWAILYLIGSGICCLGILGMTVGIVIAFVNLIRFREFPSVGIGGGLIWILALLLTPISLVGMVLGGIQGYRNAVALQQGRAVAPPQNPFIAPENPVNPDQPDPARKKSGSMGKRGKVVLTNGQIRARQSASGNTMMGAEVRVFYDLGGENPNAGQYSLVITAKGVTIKKTNIRPGLNGLVSTTVPVTSLDDGPFQARMEVFADTTAILRVVSDTIDLQVDQTPSVVPDNGANSNPGRPPGNRPGFPGLPPRGNRGPRGFPGGRP